MQVLRSAIRGIKVARRDGTILALLSGTRRLSDSPSLTATTDEAISTKLPNTHTGMAFVDSVFPVRMGRWDLRHYIGIFREETLLYNLRTHLDRVKTHNFETVSLEPHRKDGGVFVRFQYTAGDADLALAAIESDLKSEVNGGSVPSWLGLRRLEGSIWMVKGTPWREDMDWFASPALKVQFEGPDVSEQRLYELFRPYGRIQNLTQPTPVPAGTLRSTFIMFRRRNSAAIARNVLQGLKLDGTRLRVSYQTLIHSHAIRDWLSSHPKIVLPVIIFLLGSLTYTIFDPIRTTAVEAKVEDWFDFREFKVYKWLRKNTIDKLTSAYEDGDTSRACPPKAQEVWKERQEAEALMRNYLTDTPNTVAFLHGPQGSGKTRMLQALLTDMGRKTLIIDCRELQKASSDSQLISLLAKQTGYWPIFTFLNSMTSLVDLASVGMIGQKTGLSQSMSDQLQQVLDVVENALKNVSSTHRSMTERRIKEAERREEQKREDEWRQDAIRKGLYHDGRIDCVCGNGVMSELGIGDERFDPVRDSGASAVVPENASNAESINGESEGEKARKHRTAEDVEAIKSLPIVVIRNFEAKGGGSTEDAIEVLAHWAATLAENQVAHVIVVSDNRENIKRIAKALPSRPLNSIALSDADTSSALSFVKQKLEDADIRLGYDPTETACVAQLGGRASDLESLIHKVRGGQSVKEAVETIILQGVGEIRKNAFGDDVDDAKHLSWSREQAWTVLKQLAKKDEIPYHSVLLEFPFKGDETALRAMEHAELITVSTYHGRPSTIRPGKPVYRYVFERLLKDPVFQATQDIALNEKLVASSENTIKACEAELLTLKEIRGDSVHWWSRSPSASRSAFLLHKMQAAEAKLEVADLRITELKKLLQRGG